MVSGLTAQTSVASMLTAVGTLGVFAIATLTIARRAILNYLKHELRPNGGESFRDALDHRFDRIEAQVEGRHQDNQDQFREISARLSRLEAK